MPDYARDLQDLKEEVRARNDIVEIISGYTRLKKAGKNWTGLCPFHADKNPSFSVSQTNQSYRCWSCGEKGDVFTFVQKKQNLDFMEALEYLARRAGIPFERKPIDPERASEREQMLELNQLAVRFFQDRLAKSADAKAYLAQRAILKETQEQFQLGFAPPDWDAFFFHLQQKRANIALAAKLGLIKERQFEGSGYYDTFRNRLMFPIQDVNGQVIAFGGRAMSAEEKAKYLNSEQSPLFDKSRTLYGLNFARKKLSGDTPAVFVEGYVDVITAHQAGFTQCVATLGTSMTEEHARMLVRYNPRVIICYDADSAGIKATLRGIAVWESGGVEGAEVRVARLPAGEDPDSLLRRGETAAFQAALDKAVSRVDFQIELALKEHNLTTEEGRMAALAEVIPILATVKSLTQRDRYAQKVAHLHPSYQYDIGRAIAQILADAASYQLSARDKNYPRTEEANRGPLAEPTPPPTYRPPQYPNSKNWGHLPAGEWPHTRQVIRKGDGGNNGNYPRYDAGKGGYGPRDRRRNGPMSDPTPPPLTTPALSDAEKAERLLLRALFSPEWRTLLLNQLPADLLVSPQGRLLFAWIARTPADAEGGIDPRLLLNRAEREDAAAGETDAVTSEPRQTSPGQEIALFSGPPDMSNPTTEQEKQDFENQEGELVFHGEEENSGKAQVRKNSAKMSEFIRDVLEDSPSVLSNEPLNEAAVQDCLRRLRKHHKDQELRAVEETLRRDDLTREQRQTYTEQYHRMMRAMRGSPLADKGE